MYANASGSTARGNLGPANGGRYMIVRRAKPADELGSWLSSGLAKIGISKETQRAITKPVLVGAGTLIGGAAGGALASRIPISKARPVAPPPPVAMVEPTYAPQVITTYAPPPPPPPAPPVMVMPSIAREQTSTVPPFALSREMNDGVPAPVNMRSVGGMFDNIPPVALYGGAALLAILLLRK